MVKPDGHAFVGREALMERTPSVEWWEMVLLEVEPDAFDPFYAHPIMHDGAPVGIITSGANGHRTGKTLALGYLRTRGLRTCLTAEILVQPCKVHFLDARPFDPENTRLKR